MGTEAQDRIGEKLRQLENQPVQWNRDRVLAALDISKPKSQKTLAWWYYAAAAVAVFGVLFLYKSSDSTVAEAKAKDKVKDKIKVKVESGVNSPLEGQGWVAQKAGVKVEAKVMVKVKVKAKVKEGSVFEVVDDGVVVPMEVEVPAPMEQPIAQNVVVKPKKKRVEAIIGGSFQEQLVESKPKRNVSVLVLDSQSKMESYANAREEFGVRARLK